jgi:beta-lactamase regulating signal transducer with metallopeptidase domain
MGFFYSFTETILHSLWQAGLLAFSYACINICFKYVSPITKRNFLYFLLATQIVASTITFYIYFTGQTLPILSISLNNIFVVDWLNKNAVFIVSIYLLLVIMRLTAISIKWLHFKKNYTRSLLKPAVEYKIYTTIKANQLGIKRKVQIWYCKNIAAPITFGFLKPMIILPFSLVNGITQTEAEAIILHELAHIKNKDYLLNWLLVIIEIVYFFNPFIKIIAENIKLEREKNCDVQVIHFNFDKILYAQTLLKIAKNFTPTNTLQIGAATHSNQLFKRIKFFSVEDNLAFKKPNKSMYALSFLCILVLATTIVLPRYVLPKKSNAFAYNLNIAPKNIVYKPEGATTFNKTLRIEKLIKQNKIVSPNPAAQKSIMPVINKEKIDLNPSIARWAVMNDGADSIKEFIYNIETQNGKITQSYTLKLVKGKWVLQPKWMIAETNVDSISKHLYDTISNRIDSIQ